MNDRERIARVIYDATDLAMSMSEDVSDAVLAALGDRLMPELPEGWGIAYIENDCTYGKDGFDACLEHANGDVRNGWGETPAAAIRAAVAEAERGGVEG